MNDPEIPDAEDLRKLVEEIAQTHIPFGMYGPAKYPPKGCPLMDVPQEYLAWFQAKGFPKGKLGRLMEQCLLLKGNGLDSLFDPFRKANGGCGILKMNDLPLRQIRKEEPSSLPGLRPLLP